MPIGQTQAQVATSPGRYAACRNPFYMVPSGSGVIPILCSRDESSKTQPVKRQCVRSEILYSIILTLRFAKSATRDASEVGGGQRRPQPPPAPAEPRHNRRNLFVQKRKQTLEFKDFSSFPTAAAARKTRSRNASLLPDNISDPLTNKPPEITPTILAATHFASHHPQAVAVVIA